MSDIECVAIRPGYDSRAVCWPPITGSLPRRGAIEIGTLLSHDLVAEYKAMKTF